MERSTRKSCHYSEPPPSRIQIRGWSLRALLRQHERGGGGNHEECRLSLCRRASFSFRHLEDRLRQRRQDARRQRAIAYLDPANGRVSNHWIELHENGNVAGFVPLLVMDVWEHAYLLDYKPADRPKYIEAFLANVDWDVVERRMKVWDVMKRAA
jgi:hypothetical protein